MIASQPVVCVRCGVAQTHSVCEECFPALLEEGPCCDYRDHGAPSLGMRTCACPHPSHAGDSHHPFANL